MLIYCFISALIATLFTSISQVLLKLGVEKTKRNNLIYSFLNYFTLGGYVLLLVVIFLNIYALRLIPLKFMIIFLPLTYIFTGLLSFIILKESIAKHQLFGATIIIVGVLLFSL